MISCVSFSNCIHLLWLIGYFSLAIGNEKGNDTDRSILERATEDINRKIEFIDFCKSANLRVLAYPDSRKNAVSVFFELSDSKYENCFQYFDIFLEKQRRTVNSTKILYTSDAKKLSFIFENVTCGIYEILIQPCYNSWQCAALKIRYPKLINMSSSDCANALPESLSHKLMLDQSIEKEVILITAVVSIMSLIALTGLIYYYCFTVRHRVTKEKDDVENGIEKHKSVDNAIVEENKVKSIRVYILHYNSRRNAIKRKVEIVRDFLEQTSIYSNVTVIEDELVVILKNENDWLEKILEPIAEDGSINKIILIDSEEETEEGEWENENVTYTHFIDELRNYRIKRRMDYDNLFVARLRGTQNYCERLKNVVRGRRYRIPDHLIDLGLHLCSGCGLDDSEVERKLIKLWMKHPVHNSDLF